MKKKEIDFLYISDKIGILKNRNTKNRNITIRNIMVERVIYYVRYICMYIQGYQGSSGILSVSGAYWIWTDNVVYFNS